MPVLALGREKVPKYCMQDVVQTMRGVCAFASEGRMVRVSRTWDMKLT